MRAKLILFFTPSSIYSSYKTKKKGLSAETDALNIVSSISACAISGDLLGMGGMGGKNGYYFYYFYQFDINCKLFVTEKRCGFSHEAHDLKVAGSNPASVKGDERTRCKNKMGKKDKVFPLFLNL